MEHFIIASWVVENKKHTTSYWYKAASNRGRKQSFTFWDNFLSVFGLFKLIAANQKEGNSVFL